MKLRNRSNLADSPRGGPPAKGMAADGAYAAQPPAVQTSILAVGLIVLAAAAVYANSFAAPFLLDDRYWIVENPSIRHLWPIRPVLFPPNAEQIGGRPVVNLTLALNYALSETRVWGYHLVNVAIHVLAAWVLFGVVRRTLLLPPFAERFRPAAAPLALAAAMLWVIHPLQTESVTYLIQRTEALVGLFYLLALYCVIRGATSPKPRMWYVVATLACALGMATKEVMATAPLVILLYDRTFLAGSFAEAWRRRYGWYLALAATWGLVAALLILSGFHGGGTGFAVETSTWWSYLLTQPGVICHYLRLAFWPVGLCLDYHWPPAQTVGEIVLPGIVVASLLGLTVWALARWPAWGFLGGWFFVILAPTSSFVPIKDAAFEHRMYLSLAALTTGIVIGGWTVFEWLVDRGTISRLGSQVTGGALVMLIGVGFGALTVHRNLDYRSKLSIWEDTVDKAPGNERAHNNLGTALTHCGRFDEAIVQYQKALEINPNHAETLNNLGLALAHCGRLDEAIAQYQKALATEPDYAEALDNLGNALAGCGRIEEAIVQYQKAVTVKPDYAEAYSNLGLALAGRGRIEAAIANYRKALESKPDSAAVHNNLGLALASRGQSEEAIVHYRKALEIKPDYVEAHNNLANALAKGGEFDEALVHYRKALQIQPDHAQARNNLDIVQSRWEALRKALAARRELLRARPDDVALLNDTAWVLATSPNASLRNGAEAVELARRAVQLSDAREPAVLGTLAAAYAEAGRFPEAVKTGEQALVLAGSQNNAVLADALQARIKLYRADSPYRDGQQPSPSPPSRP